jgi:hypothetical protein
MFFPAEWLEETPQTLSETRVEPRRVSISRFRHAILGARILPTWKVLTIRYPQEVGSR